MSHVAFASSTSIASLSNHSSVLALANSSNARHFYPMNSSVYQSVVFQPVTKTPVCVFVEQLTRLPFVKQAWSVASYFYSKLPSFTLPVAAASTTAACTPSLCQTPTGSYEDSCHKFKMTYLPDEPDEEECELAAQCETMYEGLPYRKTSIRFPTGNSGLVLQNENGTLVVQRSREETVNARLSEVSTTAATPKALEKAQAAIIENLTPGDALTVNNDLKPTVISPENWPSKNGFSAFQRIAKATGGIVGYAPSPNTLNPLIEKMSAHILKAAESSEFIDIAFVLDTTKSMEPYIAQVQKNLVQFLQHLQEKKDGKESTCRVALVEYRDQGALFLNRINTGFTSNLDQVQTAVKSLTASGGGDDPEAVLDALLMAKNSLSWNSKAKRIVILIGDAPPQPKTVDLRYDEAAVISEYQTAGTQIAVYPVFGK